MRNRRGATAIEYGLLAALISVVTIAAVDEVGWFVEATFWQANYAIEWTQEFADQLAAAYDDPAYGNGDGMSIAEMEAYWNDKCGHCSAEDTTESIGAIFEGFDANDNGILLDGEYDAVVAWWSDPASGGMVGLELANDE
jgi:Flp pilus assembly pilin Flp